MTNSPSPSTSIWKSAVEAIKPFFNGRALFAYPILVVCIGTEIIVQWATLTYEQQSAPPNVPKFPGLGISLFGMIILMLEVFKLPMALWGASISGWRRAFCNFGILVLCILTWATIKDIGYNDSNAALAGARAKMAESARLKSNLESLDRQLVALKSNDETTREAIERDAVRLTEALDRVERELAAEIENHNRLRDQVKERSVDPGIREELAGLEDALQSRREQYRLDIDSMLAQFNSAQARNAELIQSAANAGSVELSAWIDQCKQIDADYQQRLARASADHDKAISLYQERLTAYDARRREFNTRRQEVEAEYERKCAEHRKNDGPFYDLQNRLKTERSIADKEISRLTEEFEREPRPAEPVKVTPAVPSKPPRPASSGAIAGIVDTDAIQQKVSELRNERDQFIAAQQQQIATLRQQSSSRSSSAQEQLNKELADLQQRHVAAMARISGERDSLRRAAAEATATRDATKLDPIEIQRKIAAIPDQQQELSLTINRLNKEAEQEMLDTYPGRMAQFLSYFMRDRTQEERIAVILTFFLPTLSLIMSFAPALVLEVVVHGLILDRARVLPKRRPSIWSRIRLGGKALRRERGILAAQRIEVAEMKRDLLERESRINSEVETRAQELHLALQRERDEARDALAATGQTLGKIVAAQKETIDAAVDLIGKQREDITQLANTVMEFDNAKK
jgi:hypothetical protein